MSTQVILLERIEKLGNMGEVVSVKPGYARNFLLPQRKALRASKDNIAYFEAQKKTIEADSKKLQVEAEKIASKLQGLKVALVRNASEAGQLYGSVASRDIAEGVSAESGLEIARNMVDLNQNFKTLGLFEVAIILHPEVKVNVIMNIARSLEEAKLQAETGKALISTGDDKAEVEEAATQEEPLIDEENLGAALEDDALEAEKEKAADDAEIAAEKAEKAEAKAAVKAEKAAAKAEAQAAEEAEAAVESEEGGGEVAAEKSEENSKEATEEADKE